jgi:hypothetical protein
LAAAVEVSFQYWTETAERIVDVFRQWEYGASRSPNERVSRGAPLEPPTVEEAKALIARLQEVKAELATRKTDWHGRPMGDPVQAAWGYLWEEWRNDRLGELNGYRDVWGKIDPLYEAPHGSKKLLDES